MTNNEKNPNVTPIYDFSFLQHRIMAKISTIKYCTRKMYGSSRPKQIPGVL
jgi:hypothetical protein